MDDALLVRGVQRVGDLRGDANGLLRSKRPTRDHLRQRRPLDQLEHQRAAAVPFFEAVDGCNMRMLEGGERLLDYLWEELLSALPIGRRKDLAALCLYSPVDEEIAAHLEETTRALIAAGLDPDAARAEAQRRFGDVATTRRAMTTSAMRQFGRLRSLIDAVNGQFSLEHAAFARWLVDNGRLTR